MKITQCCKNPIFEANCGQLPNDIKYKVKSNGYIAFFTEDKVIFNLPSNKKKTRNIFFMRFENKNIDTNILAKEKQIGIVNYLIGNDKLKWVTNIPTYSKIKYEEIYNNIDLYYYINNGSLEYDLVLSKDANPQEISMSFEGLDKLEIDDNDNVVLSIGDVKARLLKPQVYQIIDNVKVYIGCKYKIDEKNCIKFLVSEYEKEYELILDPIIQLDYSTFMGGDNVDIGNAIAIDSQRCAYITGVAYGTYIATPGAFQTTKPGGYDSFVTKFSSDGKNLIYSTYMGGSYEDCGEGIDVDDLGCAYITGYTYSTDYPVTTGAYKTIKESFSNPDVFITKLNETGTNLIYSTFIIASTSSHDYCYGKDIKIDSLGYAYITGYTNGMYPTTKGVHQTTHSGDTGTYDGFVTKLNQTGSALVYSTYLGGNDNDYSVTIALDSAGYIYIAGYTEGSIYPSVSGDYQTKHESEPIYDGFIVKLFQDLRSVIYGSNLGGRGSDAITAIDVDDDGYIVLTGTTTSDDFPITPGAYQMTNPFNEPSIFVTKIHVNSEGIVYSTYLGGKNVEFGSGVKMDKTGNIYVAGLTVSSDFPTTPDGYQTNYVVGYNIFLTIINPTRNELVYSTYMGGYFCEGTALALDEFGGIYITGRGDQGFPTTPGAYKTNYSGENDAVVAKFAVMDINMTWDYAPNKVKLLDVITTNLTINNSSSSKVDIKVTYELLDSTLIFIPNSLCIQGIRQNTSTIPSQIYLENILSQESSTIEMKLQYTNDTYPINIPIKVTAQIYSNSTGKSILLKTIQKQFYITTSEGPNYIPGCSQLYNLEINGVLKTTLSGVPIVYYKSGTSYIYREPNENKYVYKVLSTTDNVVEYPIII